MSESDGGRYLLLTEAPPLELVRALRMAELSEAPPEAVADPVSALRKELLLFSVFRFPRRFPFSEAFSWGAFTC